MRKELKSERAKQAFKQREKDKQRAYKQEPNLYSRNTIGHRNHNPKSQRPKCVKIVIGGIGERWWCIWAAVVV